MLRLLGMDNRIILWILTLFLLTGCGGAEFGSSPFSDYDAGPVTGSGGDVTGDSGVTPGSGGAGTGGTTATGGSSTGGAAGGSETGGAGAGGSPATGGSGAAAGAGGAPPACAPSPALLRTALTPLLPASAPWAAHSECADPVAVAGITTTAGTACVGGSCSPCTVTWGSPVVTLAGVDVPFTATCESAAKTGQNYCDARWAEKYASDCTLGMTGTGTAHIPTDAGTAHGGSVSWVVGTPTVDSTWAKSADNTCDLFTVTASEVEPAILAAVTGLSLSAVCP